MEFLKAYGTDSESSDGEYDEKQTPNTTETNESFTWELNASAVRQVYLVTYSQADLDKFPTRRSFAEAVVCSFHEFNAKVLQWVCSKESHNERQIALSHGSETWQM